MLLRIATAIILSLAINSAHAEIADPAEVAWAAGVKTPSRTSISMNSYGTFPQDDVEIDFRHYSTKSQMWVVGVGAAQFSTTYESDNSYTSRYETTKASFWAGARRITENSANARLFGEILVGGVGESNESDFSDNKSSSTNYRRSTAVGPAVRLSFGGEYMFHARAGIELSTSLEYRRLIWNFDDTASDHRAVLFNYSTIGINVYW